MPEASGTVEAFYGEGDAPGVLINQEGVRYWVPTAGPNAGKKITVNNYDEMIAEDGNIESVRIAAMEDIPQPGDEYEVAVGMPHQVVADFSDMPDTPGQVIQDHEGKRYFEPHYGPVKGQRIEMGEGAMASDVMEFAKGPPMRQADGPMPPAMPPPQQMAPPPPPPAPWPAPPQGQDPAILAALAKGY